jgi:ABC-type bacteriocin/lantibiotic exporter with double-glycine peptidase domain
MMKPVIQQEKTGCAIACSAAISGISYTKAKQLANSIGITADNSTLWSSTKPIRAILKTLGIKTGAYEIPFKTWESLPEIALLAIKWHTEKNIAYWHWVVFVRENGKGIVLDSKKSLKTNIRTDFGRMKPKWYIKVNV